MTQDSLSLPKSTLQWEKKTLWKPNFAKDSSDFTSLDCLTIICKYTKATALHSHGLWAPQRASADSQKYNQIISIS